MPNGYLGVDLFFVISGFVVSASLDARLDPGRPAGLIDFYARRIKRLYPALIACVGLTGLAAAFLIMNSNAALMTGVAALFGVSNVALWIKGKDYFAASQQLNPFTHTWSLGVEEQFYLVFPLLLFVVRRYRMNSSRIMFVVGLLSLGGYLWVAPRDPAAAFYLMPLRMWELAAGVLAYSLGGTRGELVPKKAGTLAGPLCLASGVALVPFWPANNEALLTLAATLVFTLLLYLLGAPGSGKRVLSQPWLVYLGKLSYSLYLWHWTVLTLALFVFGSRTPLTWLLPSIFLLAVGSYHFVEKPLRRAQWFGDEASHPLKVIGTGVLVATTCALFLVALPENASRGDARYTGKPSFLTKEACHLPTAVDPLATCLGAAQEGRAMLLMGDSHAGNLLEGARAAATSMGYRFAYLTDRALAMDLAGFEGCGGTICSDDEVAARISYFRTTLGKGDVVVFAMARDRLYTESFDSSVPRIPVEARLVALEKNLERLARGVVRLGAVFLVIEDVPKVCSALGYTAAPIVADACRVAEARSLRDRRPLSDLYRRVLARVNGMKIADPHHLYCRKSQCSNFVDDKLIYTDSSPHLTREASAATAPIFVQALAY